MNNSELKTLPVTKEMLGIDQKRYFWEQLWNMVATELEKNPRNMTILRSTQAHTLECDEELS